MAKQSGLHQIRGKVGEHSYYKQTGVASGLIRSINQGMSNRVKTAEEYANTRLNNAEFGHACKIAGVLGKTIAPKFRPMLLPFSQSKMAKIILDEIKLQAGNWGERSLPTGDAGKEALLSALRSVVKNDPSEYGVSIAIDGSDIEVTSSSSTTGAKCAAIGADGLLINVVRNNIQVGNYVASFRDYQYSYRVWNQGNTTLTPGTDDTISVSLPQLPPVPAGQAEAFAVTTVIIMPYREINNVQHVLQEYCTFFAE